MLNAPPRMIATWDSDGPGPAPELLVAGGNFQTAGATVLNFVGAWDGTAWLPFGQGVNGTVSFCTSFAQDGQSRLIIGGAFSHSGSTILNYVAQWRDGQWMPMAGGFSPEGADPFASIQIGEGLLMAGAFNRAGGLPVQGMVVWDGLQWSRFVGEEAGGAYALAFHQGALHAGGYYFVPGGSTLTGVLKYDGTSWSALGTNYPRGTVFALASFGGALYTGGAFDRWTNPANTIEYISRWDGASWSAVGGGLSGRVYALQVFDPDGPGPSPGQLFAGGDFTSAGGQAATCIAAWNGTTWSALGAGAFGSVRSMTVWRGQLAVAGNFLTAGGISSPGVAFWGCPQPAPCYPNCDASTTAPALNVADFSCFVARFAAGDAYANCDLSTQPPTLNVQDFTCFLQRYAAGCP